MTLVLTILMLVLSNVTKKKKGLPNVVMVLSCDICTANLMFEPSNVTQHRESSNVTIVQSYVMLV